MSLIHLVLFWVRFIPKGFFFFGANVNVIMFIISNSNCPLLVNRKERFFFFKDLFIYFWLYWVFIAACGLSLVVANRRYSSFGVKASHCGGFFCCRAQALGGLWASVVAVRGA